MKTFYLIKSFLPFLFLPIAPGVVQVELERQGILTSGSGTFLTVLIQLSLTLGILAWVTHTINRKNKAQSFLRMSCVSKKVFHQGEWVSVEKYLAEHHNIMVSHGMTPEESENWLTQAEEWCGALERSTTPYANAPTASTTHSSPSSEQRELQHA